MISTRRRSLRCFLAVVAGYALFSGSAVVLFQVSGVDPHGPSAWSFRLLATAYGGAFAWLSGYLTTRVAPDRVRSPSRVVAALVAAGALVSLISRPGEGAVWTQLEAILLFAPLVVLGGSAAWRPPSTAKT